MTDSTPPRSGFAAEVIARNADGGAAQKGPAMTNDIDTQRDAVAWLKVNLEPKRAVELAACDELPAAVVDLLTRRYTLTPRDRPDEERLSRIVAQAMDAKGMQIGEALVELLASHGFEIRRITDAPPLAPIAPRDGSYDVTIGEIVQSSAITGKDHDDAYVGAHLRGQLAALAAVAGHRA
jgi:hypothetical protein